MSPLCRARCIERSLWSHPSATGLLSISWRSRWEESRDASLRDRLIAYNADDCEALSLVSRTIVRILTPAVPSVELAAVPEVTRANIKGHLAYVWVLTNMTEVAYVLAESREAEIVRALLKDFRGVLVSDFYAAYESIPCPQQKCLIHLMRDLNDAILENPFDQEMK